MPLWRLLSDDPLSLHGYLVGSLDFNCLGTSGSSTLGKQTAFHFLQRGCGSNQAQSNTDPSRKDLEDVPSRSFHVGRQSIYHRPFMGSMRIDASPGSGSLGGEGFQMAFRGFTDWGVHPDGKMYGPSTGDSGLVEFVHQPDIFRLVQMDLCAICSVSNVAESEPIHEGPSLRDSSPLSCGLDSLMCLCVCVFAGTLFTLI